MEDTCYQYQPTPEEQDAFDELWQIANPHGEETISGQTAVNFFTASHIESQHLRKIWSLSTQNDDMNIDEFYTALRYVTLVQRGIFPVSEEVLEETIELYLGFPEFVGIHYSGDLKNSPTTLQSIEAQDVEYQSALAKMKEFNRLLDENEMKSDAVQRKIDTYESRITVLRNQVATASAGSVPRATEELPIVKGTLASTKAKLFALREQCERITKENQELTTSIAEVRQYLQDHTETGPQKEEKIKSLHALKKQLDADMLNLFTQLGTASGIGPVDALALCSSQELLEDLKIYSELDQELRARVLNFVKRSRNEDEKELFKRAVLEANLPLNTKDESLKFHLSISQRIQAVEIKIATSQVTAPVVRSSLTRTSSALAMPTMPSSVAATATTPKAGPQSVNRFK